MRRLLIVLTSVLLTSTALVAAPTAVGALPSNVAATQGGPGVLDVTWTASGDVSVVDYKVQADQNGSEVTSVIVPAGSTSAQLTGLGNGESYTVVVTARDGVPTDLGSDSVIASTEVVAPSNASISLDSVTSTSMTATFSADDGGGTNAYTLTVRSPDAAGAVVQTISGASSPASIQGLTPGTSYSVTVSADNGVGSPATAEDSATTPNIAPSLVNVTLEAATATSIEVAWVFSGTNLTYTASIAPDDGGGAGFLTDSAATTTTFTGLDPDTDYVVTVVAQNDQGDATGTLNASTTPPPVVAPTNATISLGSITDNSMVATFSADDGGGTNSYTLVVRTPNAAGATVQTIPNAVSPATISGLDPNTAYSVTVTADNGVAPAATAEAAATTAAGQASAPQNVQAVLAGPANNFVRVNFSPPADLAGGTVINYTVELSNGAALTVASSPATFENVPAGSTVTARVLATTQAGPGAQSDPSNAVTTAEVPGPVTGLTAEWAGAANVNSIDVAWTAPGDTGGLPLTGYVVSVSPELDDPIPVVDPGQTSVTIGGLEQGTSYTVTVRAQNDLGNSSGTSSGSVLVPTTPGTVTNLLVQQSPPFSSGIVLTWDLPEDDGGSPITGYQVSVDDQQTDVGPDITTVSFANLPVGDHNVTVRAITAAGLGAAVTSPNFEVKAFPPFDSEEAFVTQIYADFLKRTPDAGGLAFWTARVNDDGSNVQEIIEAFMRSPEFSPRRSVARLYFAYFNRQPDKAGFDFWTSRIASGAASIETVSQDFVLSPEFIEATKIEDPPNSGQFRQLTDGEYVVFVYNAVLARRPDTDGFRFWLAQLQAGVPRGRLMTLFSESPENIGLSRSAVDVTVTYDGMLQRRPEAGGFAFWRDRIAGDNNALATLIREFYFSPEYAERVTR